MPRPASTQRGCCRGLPAAARPRSTCSAPNAALARGGGVLVLVPEIGLTPQLVQRFRQRLDVELAVLHSALSDAERLAAWRAARAGQARIVLGTRSAVFAPLPELGLIVVDEEHDSSYKQHEGGCRYSARDLAVVRAQQAGMPVVLGSATPAFETLHNVERRALPRLPCRAGTIRRRRRGWRWWTCAPMPCIRACRRRWSRRSAGIWPRRRRYWCSSTAAAMRRRCCAPPAAGSRPATPVRRAPDGAPRQRPAALPPLRCHASRCRSAACAAASRSSPSARAPSASRKRCASCFPASALLRLDRDTASRPGELEAIISAACASGAARILVGTQMVTKGHHFPGITLVVVLNADQGLFSTDFRAAERLAQTIVQVAGRAGRERAPRRGADPDRVSRASVAAEPAVPAATRASRQSALARARGRALAAVRPPGGAARLDAARAAARSASCAAARAAGTRGRAGCGCSVRCPRPWRDAPDRYYAQLLIESARAQPAAPLHRPVAAAASSALARAQRVR